MDPQLSYSKDPVQVYTQSKIIGIYKQENLEKNIFEKWLYYKLHISTFLDGFDNKHTLLKLLTH